MSAIAASINLENYTLSLHRYSSRGMAAVSCYMHSEPGRIEGDFILTATPEQCDELIAALQGAKACCLVERENAIIPSEWMDKQMTGPTGELEVAHV